MQHAFTSNLSLDVSYVGTHAGNLIGSIDLNQAPAGSEYCLNALTTAQLDPATGACNPSSGKANFMIATLAVQEARPYNVQYPYLAFINRTVNDARSRYNSLQATLTERPAHGLSFTVGYTYGHGLDNGSLNRFGGQPQDSTNPLAEFSNSDFDVRHRATITASYELPGKKGFGQLLEGWKINSIVSVQSAQPWNIADQSNNFTTNGDKNVRWDFFGNPADFKSGGDSIPYCTGPGPGGCSVTSGIYLNTVGLSASQSAAMWAKCTAAAPTLAAGGCYVDGNSVMVPPAPGTFGTMGRNIFRDNGFRNWDLSLFKSFTFKERFGAQFRFEVFDVLNRATISNPNGANARATS